MAKQVIDPESTSWFTETGPIVIVIALMALSSGLGCVLAQQQPSDENFCKAALTDVTMETHKGYDSAGGGGVWPYWYEGGTAKAIEEAATLKRFQITEKYTVTCTRTQQSPWVFIAQLTNREPR